MWCRTQSCCPSAVRSAPTSRRPTRPRSRTLLASYDEQAGLVDGPRHAIEQARYHEWQDQAEGAGAAIAGRRATIIERGRAQQG